MKKNFLTILSFSLLAACSLEGVESVDTESCEVQFSASQLTTRAYDTTWESGDRIGVYATSVGDSGAAVKSENIEYAVSSVDGSMAVISVSNKIKIDDSSTPPTVDYYAYYPYSASIESSVYPVNLTDQSNTSAIDLLWSEVTGSTDLEVDLQFSHQLVKLNVEFTIDSKLSDESLTGASATLYFSYATMEFDLSNGTFSSKERGDISLPLSVAEDGESATTTAIVAPISADDYRALKIIVTTASGDSYTYILSDSDGITLWESGKEYTYLDIKLSPPVEED